MRLILLGILLVLASLQVTTSHGDHPLSRIAIHKARFALNEHAYVKASPTILGLKGQNSEWVTVEFSSPNPSVDDWIGVFSPSNFSAASCSAVNPRVYPPLLCSAPIKFQFANYSSPRYKNTGKGFLKLQMINQRTDFSFALFSGGLLNPKLVAVSNKVAFTNPNVPVYPRLAQGKMWNEMTVTWTSGYGINEAEPFVEWGPKGGDSIRSPAGTLTFDRSSMCDAPAKTVGWRDPGYIHTSFLKELWPNKVYIYKLGHRLFNGTYIWSQEYHFKASPYPGENSLQRVVIFGDMGKDEADGSNEYNNFQHGSLNTTKQLIQDLKNIDIVFHIGDISYANGYLSQWTAPSPEQNQTSEQGKKKKNQAFELVKFCESLCFSVAMEHAELTIEQVLKRDIPWETYMTTKLISGTGLQLLRRYDNRSESHRAQLLDDDGPAYVRVFVSILRDIFKEETVEYVLALMDEMLTANPKRARLFHDQSLLNEDTYEPFLRLLWKGNWFVQEKSCKILALIVSARPKTQDNIVSNGEASHSKEKFTTLDDVLKGLVEWLCSQLKKPSHPSRGIPVAVNCLAALLKEPLVRSSFVQVDGVKLLIPLISPASTQQSIQLLYETCLCIWLLSFYEPAIEYLATSRALPRLIEVVKSSTKEKVVRVVVLTLRNLLPKGAFAAQMIDLGLLQIVQSLKAQAWSDEDLLDTLNQLEEGLKDNIKRLSSFDKYKQEVLLGHLDWSAMHKDPLFWRDNITSFEENDFQILRVLITVLDTSNDPRALSVACFDLSQFIQYHPAGRIIVTDLKAKERVMKLMNHENAEVTKNSLLCIQRLFLGAKYASFLQA